MGEYFKNLDIVTLLLGATLGAVLSTLLSTWHSYFVRQPRLVVTGGGGGGGVARGFHERHATISNPPGLIGLKIDGSSLFGFRLHNRVEMGAVVERSPARECRAFLYDTESGQHISQLWWRTRDGSMSDHATIGSGEIATLMLFARLNDEPLKYFPYRPVSNQDKTPVVPSDEQKFDSTREFFVRINHSYGKKHLKFKVKVTKGFDGRLSLLAEGSGGSF